MKNTHLFLNVVDTFVLTHNVTHVAKEQDLGTRSGCHSNVPEIKAVLFFNFFIYLLTILFVSVVPLFSFHLFRFGGFVSLFRVLVHAISELVSESGYCSDAFAM